MIFELSCRYGFSNFVIVVPGVVIREGVNGNRRHRWARAREYGSAWPRNRTLLTRADHPAGLPSHALHHLLQGRPSRFVIRPASMSAWRARNCSSSLSVWGPRSSALVGRFGDFLDADRISEG